MENRDFKVAIGVMISQVNETAVILIVTLTSGAVKKR
jgi:hypothetical protein